MQSCTFFIPAQAIADVAGNLECERAKLWESHSSPERSFLSPELIMPKRAKPIRPPPVGVRPKNKLLACLPRKDFEQLRPRCFS